MCSILTSGCQFVSVLNFLSNGIYSPPASYLLYYTISGTAAKQQCKLHSVEDQDIHIYNYNYVDAHICSMLNVWHDQLEPHCMLLLSYK